MFTFKPKPTSVLRKRLMLAGLFALLMGIVFSQLTYAQEPTEKATDTDLAGDLSAVITAVNFNRDAIEVTVAGVKESNSRLELSLHNQEGQVIARNQTAANKHDKSGNVYLLPFKVPEKPLSGQTFKLVASGENIHATTNFDVNTVCSTETDGVICTYTTRLHNETSNAIRVSAELSAVLDEIKADGRTRGNLLDIVTERNPKLRGDVLDYASQVRSIINGVGGTPDPNIDPNECNCYWKQSIGYKSPATANNLYSHPTGQTWTGGWEGPGALSTINARHKGTRWTGKRSIEGEAEGTTLKTFYLDCFGVTKWETVIEEIDFPPYDGIPDIIVEYEIPVEWGPCDKACDATVDALGETYITAEADPYGYGNKKLAKAWADSHIDYYLNGAHLSNLDADAYANKRGYDFDFDEDIQVTTVAEPAEVRFESDVHVRVEGRARDDVKAKATASYSYALYGDAQCAANGPAYTFEAASYIDRLPDFCTNIKNFYSSRGLTVACNP